MYNTKFAQKLAFAYRNCPLSLETTKHFQANINSICDLVLKIFLNVLFTTQLMDLYILIFAQRAGLQSVTPTTVVD